MFQILSLTLVLLAASVSASVLVPGESLDVFNSQSNQAGLSYDKTSPEYIQAYNQYLVEFEADEADDNTKTAETTEHLIGTPLSPALHRLHRRSLHASPWQCYNMCRFWPGFIGCCRRDTRTGTWRAGRNTPATRWHQDTGPYM